jgi:large subunit ribosomal protein L17
MRHAKKGRTLGRTKALRKALLRNLAESLILHGSIRTTTAKAKELRSIVEPLVTKARRGSMSDRRAVGKVLYTPKAIKMLMSDIGPRYKDRQGGYTRITKTGFRPSDGADVSVIEFV